MRAGVLCILLQIKKSSFLFEVGSIQMNNYSKITLTMVRDFDVVPEEIFEAWINPEMMKKWFFTLEGTNKVAKNTLEVGGSWEIVDYRDGNDYRAIGQYIEID